MQFQAAPLHDTQQKLSTLTPQHCASAGGPSCTLAPRMTNPHILLQGYILLDSSKPVVMTQTQIPLPSPEMSQTSHISLPLELLTHSFCINSGDFGSRRDDFHLSTLCLEAKPLAQFPCLQGYTATL